MAKNRAQLQAQRNKAVVAQRQAKLKSGIGSPAHRKAIATTKALGKKMKARSDAGDKSKASHAILISNVDEYVDSRGALKKKTSVAPSVSSGGAAGRAGGGAARVGGGDGRMSIPSTFTLTRGGYNPTTRVDYTNTNPAYWNSVVSYFKQNPGGNPDTGELGIWTPNFEKQGAESTALAAIAGGVTAHVGSNYSNNTVDDATAKRLGHASIDEHGRASTYRGGAEKAIRLNSISRGGTHIDTGRPMGGTDPIGYGAHIKGGVVTKDAMPGYLKDGGDFGGLLGIGTSITGDWLTGLLGGMDGDGMRLRGTMPAPRGATSYGGGGGSGGMAGGYGGGYAGGGISGGGPVVPTYMSDWSKFMPKDFSLGEAMYDTGGKEVAPGGFLYQPHAADYLGGMSSPGGMLGGGGYMGGGMLGGAPSGPFTGTGGAGPSVTYSGSRSPISIPDPAAMAGRPGAPGTRDGMLPGMHSSHLGAYESRPGVWVWGDRPSASGDAAAIGGGGLAPDAATYAADPSAYGYGYVGAPGAGWPPTGMLSTLMSTEESRAMAAGGDVFGGATGEEAAGMASGGAHGGSTPGMGIW